MRGTHVTDTLMGWQRAMGVLKGVGSDEPEEEKDQ